MKQNLLLAALLAVTFNSYATERSNPSQGGQASSNAAAGSLAVAGAAALSSSGATASSGGGSASVGDLTVNGDDYDAKRIPVSSAIAPNTHQNGDCPFISPSTKAIQLPFAGGSGTTGVTLNTICVAKWLGQHEVVERMACNADAAYRKANPNCGE